ncbi:MAG: single-stranded DNA-binding protein [Angelakisella sp.]|jgi:single-strand DNA-binding protein|nr:single-stranded DNA-binding protein [Angelakisella sp.]
MFNKAILIGRLTADPELKQTTSGIYLVNFQIAVDRRFKGQDGERKADFITIVCWRQQAEFVSKYFHKGDAIGIEGTIQTRNYEDRQGNKRTAVEVVADNVFFVGGKSSGSAGPAMQAVPATPAPAAPVAYSSGAASDFEEVETDNDLPF